MLLPYEPFWVGQCYNICVWYHLVLQETNEERRTVVNNLASVFTTAANHLSIVEKFLEDQHKRVDRVYTEAFREDEVDIQKLKDMMESFITKANSL
ncbi:hypothetical protein J4Q44_G00160790 [Coregonus suidteri]|uniref:Kinetochore protein NDC80 loop region domain-containing protein n=1 Tax=Coregonus suidteri TaxID=861788 RepID=A0AAN8LQR9_9TELE